ncbi:hypothetical protein ACFP51_02505 [Streptomyces pratens]|uniref:Uncharacterized protein n=1 Tax=Streptomyces pratens TaxID=887456 RepID=A0ABW1M3P5_9ACTN
MKVLPERSDRPKGGRICYFDRGHGRLLYVLVRRAEDPQIIVEEVFRQ